MAKEKGWHLARRYHWALLLPALLLGGCDTVSDFFSQPDRGPKVVGERISVLAFDSQLDPDPQLAQTPVLLPKPWANADWPQAGGYPSHAMQHLALGETLREAWNADIGSAGDDQTKILGQPVVAEGRIFTKDAESKISAYDVNTGRRLWRVDLTPKGETEGALGGGLAYADGKLFVATAYGDVVALQPNTGLIYWHVALKLPVRGAPGVDAGRVFVITQDNQLFALDGDSGRQLWTHAGLVEAAGLLGAAAPAVEGSTVVAPFSSGEVVSLRAESGTVGWSEQLVRTAGRVNAIGALNDINALPVIDRGRVYAVSQSGRFVAIDQRTGERVWERAIGATQTPWVAGDFIYVVTVDAEILCLSRRDGKVKWIRQLQRYKDPTAPVRKGVITWYGPVLAGDRLIVASSDERAYALSPYNGDLIGAIKLSGPAAVPPVVAGQTAYILTEDARLTAFR
ncbi:PQQ-binding-like beta-propeller repeat protein [Ferrovibrio sp.]|uniref:outer membrane protein assembly factor BamB family protein n=1 Tax=Ferrovibrio sp. TaxID=1917215 RepID=UPI001B56BB48|nr:PQQ-binding-like beta-propeller repeat protein [Ferrovibrio sp.]MBP7065819.1 PQQ-binding-like beta-propeller repeat protein [Ferrovibrio sp.]